MNQTIADTQDRVLPLQANSASGGPFVHDRFLLKQKRLALTEKYVLFDEQDQQVLFVRREAHHLRQLVALLSAIAGGAIVAVGFIAPAMALDQRKHETLSIVLVIVGIVLAIAATFAIG